MSCRCCGRNNGQNTAVNSAAETSYGGISNGANRCSDSFWPHFARLPGDASASGNSSGGTVSSGGSGGCCRR